MPPSRLFVDPDTGDLDTVRIVDEAIPIARLVGFFGIVALVPMVLASLMNQFGLGFAGWFLTLASQFVLAVGTGIVLLYVLVRANRITDE